jgi:hypothetical protein
MKGSALRRHLSVLCAIAATLVAPWASATPFLSTQVLPIYQVGNGAGVNMGHIVNASTAYNRLIAGGTFNASCADSLMMPATGQRTVSKDNFGGGIVMHVTIPETVPALVSMPGFYSLPRGTTVQCTYSWTSRAVEGGYTIGASGFSYQTGNGELSEGFFRPFQMSVPGDTNTGDWQGCIP